MKILMIGNSYTNDTIEHAYHVAVDMGVRKPYFAYLYIGGTALQDHAANARNDMPNYEYRTNLSGRWQIAFGYSIKEVLQAEKWDYIGLQQASIFAGQANSFKDLDFLIGYIKQNLKEGCNPKLIWNMTWTYPKFCNTKEFNTYYNKDTDKMYKAIITNVRNIIMKSGEFSVIIPNGTAVRNARTSCLGDENIYRDEIHLSLYMGRYIAALTMMGAICGKSPEEVNYAPSVLNELEIKIAKESASNALKNPFEVTASQYRGC